MFLKKTLLFIYLTERAREQTGGGAERGRGRESQADSAPSAEPNTQGYIDDGVSHN